MMTSAPGARLGRITLITILATAAALVAVLLPTAAHAATGHPGLAGAQPPGRA
jgi:hypothetical protein